MNIKKGIVLPDLQWPNHNEKLLGLWEEYLASQEWDYLIYLGDFADMDAISHHAMNGGDYRSIEGKRLKHDYQAMSEILIRHRSIAGPDCEIYWLQGNHEEWAERFVDKYPALEGMIEIEENLPFEFLGIELIEYRKYLKLGELFFIHGDLSRGYTPVFHAKKVVETYNRDVVYGHHHTVQTATKISPFGIHEAFTANCLPAMCNIEPSWAGNRPNHWVNGFGIFYINGKHHNVYPIVSRGNTFVTPDGQVFGGIKKVRVTA